MSSYKKTENDVYAFLNKKFRIGWSPTAVANFYNNLNYADSKDESYELNNALGSNIALPDHSDITNDPSLSFSVKKLTNMVYTSRCKLDELRRIKESYETALVELLDEQDKTSTFMGYYYD